MSLPKSGSTLPLLTRLAKPTSGSVLRGETFFVAAATGDYPIKGVDFRIISSTTGSAIVLHGAKFEYGWLGVWLSTALPNGNYSVQSIVHDTAGHMSRSRAVSVVVQN